MCYDQDLYYNGYRVAKRDLERFGEKCCLKIIETFTKRKWREQRLNTVI